MNFDFNDTENRLREKIQAVFSDTAADPLEKPALEETETIRKESLKYMKRLGSTGYLNLCLDGAPYGPATVLAQETLAALSPSLYLCAETTVRILGRLVNTYGDSAAKAEILSALTTGELIGAVAFSEAGFDETIADMETVGRPAADGFEVTGRKTHAVNGPISDWIAVAGKMETEGLPAFFLMKRGSPGLSTGSRHRTLGYDGVAASGISLDACQISSHHVIRPPERGNLLSTVRLWDNQVLATAGLGLMQRTFDAAVGHAKTHQSGGKPLIAYQEIGFKLSEMLTLVQTARLLVYRAAWMAEAGEHEAETLAHCAKVFCTESAEEVNSKALQILGETGFIGRNPAEQGYRNARYLQIAGTASELSRMKIGDGLLDFH